MSFEEINSLIPCLDYIEAYTRSTPLPAVLGQYHLIVVRRGHVTVFLESGESVICTQGYACHPGSGDYRIEVPRTKAAEYVIFTYRMLPLEQEWTLEGPLGTYSEVKIHYMVDELLRKMQEELPEEGRPEAAAFRYRTRLMLERILYIFLRESLMKKNEGSVARSIEDTITYMNEHYMLPLTLSMLAGRAGMSEGHYTVLFKKQTGRTMTVYLRSLRIEKAKQLFRQTRLPAKEIAQQVGFSDYFYFSRMFKKEVGMSPSEYLTSVKPNQI
ncbi:helix-turn-helix domain-containing protein [Paenibacillus sp. JDR-2]|uniref:helix-turn-helix domain-containing protein n=1 Tax=Paenibacillus sp. (strain JDR-2) TaxID=324057 RepID=UPI000166B1C6|nr:AraC family transcriptional regulator [Paenibacillus sp. JDR-2]ACS99064.1 transcriptional regulator, AraC family [Paenibacillus sp. JDR-2]